MKNINKLSKIIKNKLSAIRLLYRESKIYFKNTVFSTNVICNKKSIERDIIVYSHTIEKGLSHFKIKPLFGYVKTKNLYDLLLKYNKYDEKDEYILKLGVSSIEKYNEVNIKLGIDNEKLFIIPKEMQKYNTYDVGAYKINEKDIFSKNDMDFENFAKSRHSIRLYDTQSEKVDKNILLKSINLAQTAPSACNRQSVKTTIILEKDKIKKISNIQGGSTGFGENAGALIIIKVDLNKYQIQERRLPAFDAGLFAMNLLYSLHYYKLGVCTLNGSFTKKQINELKNVIEIKDSELIVSIFAINKVPRGKDILIAKSIRRPLNDIIEIIE